MDKQMRINVIQRPWRVVYAVNSRLDQLTIKSTIEAESWNKAHLKASDEALQIAELLGAEPGDVKVESVTGLAVASE